MSDQYSEILRSVAETNEKIGTFLEKMNTAPLETSVATGTQTVGTQVAPTTRRGVLSGEERMFLHEELSRKSNADLSAMFSAQMRKRDAGVPLDQWLGAGGYTLQNALGQLQSNHVDMDIAKAIDTNDAGVLIRQDLEPLLYQVFVRQFPFYDRVPKEPANGLVHAFNRITDYGAATFMPELGTVTDDKSTYERATTNVAILATRRGVTLKSQFAVAAGGMAWSPEAIEMQGGLRSIAHKMQQTIFAGNNNPSYSGATSNNEAGAYDPDAFTGLRQILMDGSSPVNVDPSTNPTTTGNIRRAMDSAILAPIQAGATGPWEIWSHPSEKITFDEQQDANVRILEASQRGASIGVITQAVNTIGGQLGWNIVPGDSIGTYVDGGHIYRDVYITDMSGISLPYLGTPGPTVLEIPVGISGQLTRLFIIFLMNGMAVKVPQFSNKVRVYLGED